ncbi:MAG: hypothetical protein AAGD13_13630 [Pseudomonadota bacterium]
MTQAPLPPHPVWLIAGPVLFFAGIWSVSGPPCATALAVGALGWVLALVPRPLLASKISPWSMVMLSGPAEEITRLGAIWLAAPDLRTAIWLGFGWAAIEAVAGAVSTHGTRRVLRNGGEQAEALRKAIGKQLDRPGLSLAAMSERVGTTSLHLGLTLFLFAGPVWLLPAIAMHSGANLAAVRLAGTGRLLVTQAVVMLLGAGAFVLGLRLNGLL